MFRFDKNYNLLCASQKNTLPIAPAIISRKHFLRCLALSGLAVSLPFSWASAKQADQARSRYRLEPQRGYKYPPSFLRLALRKSCRAMELLGGVRITPGGLTQAFQCAGKKRAADYDLLGLEMAGASVVHTDETSWWVGGTAKLLGLCQAAT